MPRVQYSGTPMDDTITNDYARRIQTPATYTIYEEGGTYYAVKLDP